jgi:DNA polymerase-3 subunit alpha
MREFTNIHAHSDRSFQDGICTPEEMIVAAKEKGLRSMAITDHGHAHAHADFYLAAKKHQYKAIFGVEAYVIHSLTEWRELKERMAEERAARKKKSSDDDTQVEEVDLDEAALQDKKNRRLLNRKGHLVLLAQNQDGLSNIYQIVHKAHKFGYYMKPRADKEILAQHSRGVIASSACMGGVVSNKLWAFQREEIEWAEVVREAREMDEIFGRNNFYLEMQSNEHENQCWINSMLVRLHYETGIPMVVTLDSHYVKPDDWETQELLHMLMSHRSKRPITKGTLPEGYDFKVKSLYVRSGDELWEDFVRRNPSIPVEVLEQAFANTLDIDSRIEAYNPDTRPRLPTLPYPNPLKEMADSAIQGLRSRNLHEDDRYTQRLLYELGVIKEKGIAPYFLVVRNIVDEAKKQMLIGPGRGSAAGSLLCYLLGITNIDPIEHKLMFERFINVDRVELPDIDLDFEDVDDVKDILRGMFGEDNVACISAYGTNQIKGLLKDVCRLHDIDHQEVNKVNAQIENELKALYKEGETRSTVTVKIEDIYRLSPTFKAFIQKYPQIEKPVSRLYGRTHHVSRHASGVVIGDNLPAETAVFYSSGKGKDGKTQKILQTSFTDGIVNKNLSSMGLVKFDILSLATLKVIRKTCELLAARSGRPVQDFLDEIDPKRMDFNDQKVMETVFWPGNLTGIFQASQKGMRRLLMQARPTTFDDVSAVCALYRPGPLGSGMDQLFCRRKHGEEEVTYDHPFLREILGDTYGCLVYQEQLLEIGRRLGNMSWKDVNRLRKLFLKKDKSKQDDFVKKEEEELRQKLIDGCVSHGLTAEKGAELWEMLSFFGGYGFNVAHAKSYGMVTMQTAYLRTYHPVEFFAAVLACGQTGEVQEDVDDIRRQGFKVLPVDVNLSRQDFQLEEDSIRLSLNSVHGIGKKAAEKIIENGPYTDFLDFLRRSKANKTAIEALIKVGAFERFGDHPALLLARYELYVKMKGHLKKGREDFEAAYAALTAEPADPGTLSAWERELIGFNILYSPFVMNGRAQKIQMFLDAGVAIEYDDFLEREDTDQAYVPVFLKDWKERPQKNKQMMAFLKFGTPDGREFEAPCFGGVWPMLKNTLRKNDIYIACFHRKDGDQGRLIVGKPGWRHERKDVMGFFLRVDDLE